MLDILSRFSTITYSIIIGSVFDLFEAGRLGSRKVAAKRLKVKGQKSTAEGARLAVQGVDVGGLRIADGGTISNSQLPSLPASWLPGFCT